jgi:hypothetical protein
MISYIIGIGGSVILAAIISFLWVFKSNKDGQDPDTDYLG